MGRLRGGWIAVVALAICGLTISLATRTFRLTCADTATVKSGSATAMRQHLDRDTEQWIPPAPTVALMPDVPFDQVPVAPGFALSTAPDDASLYTRPPPSCES
jgi:hypothetical protein